MNLYYQNRCAKISSRQEVSFMERHAFAMKVKKEK